MSFAHLNLPARPDYPLYVCHLASSSLRLSLSPALLLKWGRAFSSLSNFHELWTPTVQLGRKRLAICTTPLLRKLWKARHWNLVRNTLFLYRQHEFLKLFWPPTVPQNYARHTKHPPICPSHCEGKFLQWWLKLLLVNLVIFMIFMLMNCLLHIFLIAHKNYGH